MVMHIATRLAPYIAILIVFLFSLYAEAQTDVATYALPYNDTNKPEGVTLIGPKSDKHSTKVMLPSAGRKVTVSVSHQVSMDQGERFLDRVGMNFEIDGQVLQLAAIRSSPELKSQSLKANFRFGYWGDGQVLEESLYWLDKLMSEADDRTIVEADTNKAAARLGRYYPYIHIKESGRTIQAQEIIFLEMPILVFYSAIEVSGENDHVNVSPDFWHFFFPGWKISLYAPLQEIPRVRSIERINETTRSDLHDLVRDDLSLVQLVPDHKEWRLKQPLKETPWESIVDLSHPEKIVLDYPDKKVVISQTTDPRLYLKQVDPRAAYTATNFEVNGYTVQYAHHLHRHHLPEVKQPIMRARLFSSGQKKYMSASWLGRFSNFFESPTLVVNNEPDWLEDSSASQDLEFVLDDVRFTATYRHVASSNFLVRIKVEFPQNPAVFGPGYPTLNFDLREHSSNDGIEHYYQSFLTHIIASSTSRSTLDRKR